MDDNIVYLRRRLLTLAPHDDRWWGWRCKTCWVLRWWHWRPVVKLMALALLLVGIFAALGRWVQ
jgi:hypothetical protein